MAARESISPEMRLARKREVGVSRHHHCRSTIACLASPHPTSHPTTQLVRRQNAQDRADMFTFAEQHAARRWDVFNSKLASLERSFQRGLEIQSLNNIVVKKKLPILTAAAAAASQRRASAFSPAHSHASPGQHHTRHAIIGSPTRSAVEASAEDNAVVRDIGGRLCCAPSIARIVCRLAPLDAQEDINTNSIISNDDSGRKHRRNDMSTYNNINSNSSTWDTDTSWRTSAASSSTCSSPQRSSGFKRDMCTPDTEEDDDDDDDYCL
ncbi:hypothetical protein B0T24DRAFT_87884 [Lasiosphaeria ovina]|uniref:Uncharacterized protein n=1 Tax=Lasiosphaeria ovina TaxID=92902 RepID=A0AAE0TYW3_9PEZI|nr:hypothetical protein B0T24DRAFT_87884 [Lasiosphaeria ovina]